MWGVEEPPCEVKADSLSSLKVASGASRGVLPVHIPHVVPLRPHRDGPSKGGVSIPQDGVEADCCPAREGVGDGAEASCHRSVPAPRKTLTTTLFVNLLPGPVIVAEVLLLHKAWVISLHKPVLLEQSLLVRPGGYLYFLASYVLGGVGVNPGGPEVRLTMSAGLPRAIRPHANF